MKIVAIVISLLYFGALGYVVVTWDRFSGALDEPAGEGAELKTVVVPKGATASDVPDILAKAGVLDDASAFQAYVDRFRVERPIKGGEYAIAPSMSPSQQLARIESGQVVTYTIVVLPGATGREVATTLASEQLGDPDQLVRLIDDASVAARLGIPGPTLEGYLLPDAYDLPRGLENEALLGRLVERFRQTVGDSIKTGQRPRGLGEYEIVTVASMVEKATIPSKERRYYAAVLLNRLAKKMPLQSKAALEYGEARVAKPPPDKKRRRRRNKQKNPWDTMRVAGLPKTPICNPSAASITAVLNPAPVRAVFMVKRDDGTHVYCEDLECYYAARRRWGPPLPTIAVPPPSDLDAP